MEILLFVVAALMVESIWETSKLVWQNGKVSIDRIGAIVIGLLMSLGTGLDLLSVVGLNIRIPFVGMILTGLLISRGANFLHDLLKKVDQVNEPTELVNK